MKKTTRPFPHADKLWLLLAGLAITLVCRHLLDQPVIISMGLAVMAGLFIEVWDSFTGGRSSGHDWAATLLGSLLSAPFL